MATQASARQRLDPAIFRLPVERIRQRLLLRRVLRLHQAAARGRGPPPARDDAGLPEAASRVLGGIDEAIAVLKLCAGHEQRRRLDPGVGRARGPRAARGRRDRPARDGDDDRGRLQPVRPSRDRLPRLARAPVADHAQRRARSSRPPAASRSSTSPRATTTGSCRPATAGARTSPARSASPPTRRRRGGAGAGSAPSRTG